MSDTSKAGVLVISHGSRSPVWVEMVDRAVADVGWTGAVPVVSSFLEIVEGRLIQDGIDALEAQGVTDLVVVPLFVSYGSTHVDEIRWALGDLPRPSAETDLEPFRVRARVHVCPPLDDDPVVAEILYEHMRDLSVSPEQEAVLLIGHGSELPFFYSRWKRGMDQVAAELKALGGFAEVRSVLLLPDETLDTLRSWRRESPERDVIAASLFLSEGYFTEKVIPARLNGFGCRYNGRALLPHRGISRWMERNIAEALNQIGLPVRHS